jgi:multidrug resistance efflux pump
MPDMAFRMQAPIGLTLRDGQRIPVADWSLKGVSAPELIDRDHQHCVLSIPFQGIVLSFPVTLEPGDEPGFFEFRGLDGRQRETLGLFYRSLLSGKMATTGDMITSLDTPVDLIPMEETEQERFLAEHTQTPRSLRAISVMAVYIVLFMTVFGFLANLAWTRLNEINLQHARFTAQMETLHAGETGFVAEVYHEAGEFIAAGEPVLRLADPEAEGKLEELTFEVEAAALNLQDLRREIQSHETSRTGHRQPFIEALEDAVKRRRPSDFFASRDLDDVMAAYERLKAFDLGLSAEQRDFNATLNELVDRREERKRALRQLERERDSFAESLGALTVIAPRDGRVDNFHVVDGQYIRAGSPVAEFEANSARTAVGWLDHRHSGNVFEGMPAKITFNIAGDERTVKAKVTRVEAELDLASPNSYGIMVTVTANDIEEDETRALFLRYAPARVRLSREMLGGFLSTF